MSQSKWFIAKKIKIKIELNLEGNHLINSKISSIHHTSDTRYYYYIPNFSPDNIYIYIYI
jgi:hypothetical protein